MTASPVRLLALGLLLLSAACSDEPTDVEGAPVISARLPERDAAGVSLNPEIVVEFNEAIVLPPDTASALRLARSTGFVRGALSLEGRKLRFRPQTALDPGTRYEVVVTGLADQGGNVMSGAVSWSFTTLGRTPPSVAAGALQVQVARLAADSMAGRGSGTADEQRAAAYLQTQFLAAGLQAYASDVLQPFPIAPARVGGRTGVTSQNVIATIPGNGALRNEWIVLGAHYDHVGVRTVGGAAQIFNGADDNASGTAVLLEVARELRAYLAAGGTGNEPRRSIMFQAFGAEELGLLGSEHYCAQPWAPMSTVAAMLNFDMVGRLRNNELMVGGLPTSSEWSALLGDYNAPSFVLQSTDCGGCTDFACFRRAQRPVLWFFTGMHPEYHQPSDDVGLINADGMSGIATMATRLVVNLATRVRPLQ